MTPHQLKAFDFVRETIVTIGFAPTLEEIGRHLDLSAKSGVKRLIDELVKHGWLRRTGAKFRGLAVAGMPDLRAAPTEALHAELARRGQTLGALDVPAPESTGRFASCAADTCWAPVKRGHMFCRDHWFKLPPELREELFAAHRSRDVDRFQEAFTRARDVADGCGGPF